jgi:hypothetical protein
MILQATIIFGASIVLFLVLYLLVGLEKKKEKRLVLSGLRKGLDNFLDFIFSKVAINWRHFTKYVVQLHWYYSIHSVLKGILRVIVAFYTYFENVFENNRRRTRKLRAEKKKLRTNSHLDQVAEHKEETALTTKQKQTLRNQKLEERP